jgi:ribosomal protein L16/L10AE
MKRLRIKQYPRRYRYKFPHIYRRLNNKSLNSSSASVTIQNGFYYVKILEPCRIQFYLIRSLFNLLRRATKGSVELWFYGCFFLPLTGKPLMRMGTGKGK